jgi:hypothetical protein
LKYKEFKQNYPVALKKSHPMEWKFLSDTHHHLFKNRTNEQFGRIWKFCAGLVFFS